MFYMTQPLCKLSAASLKELLCIGGHVYCLYHPPNGKENEKAGCKQAGKSLWIVFTLAELRLWDLLSSDYCRILYSSLDA